MFSKSLAGICLCTGTTALAEEPNSADEFLLSDAGTLKRIDFKHMSNIIKRTNDELKADRPTLDEVKKIPRLPISILVENVRSVHNVGSIFRSADGFGAEMIYLAG